MSQARSGREVALSFTIFVFNANNGRRQSEILGLNDSSGGISLLDILPPSFGDPNVPAKSN